MRWRVLAAAAAVVSGAFVLSVPTTEATPLPPPAAFQGRLVDSLSGTPLGGVVVHLTDTNGVDLPGLAAVTPPNGTFDIPVPGEEYGLRIDGGPISYEIGWLGCDSVIQPDWGSACTFSPRDFGDIVVHTRLFSGRVVDSRTGVGVVGARVWLTDTSGVKIPGASVLTGPLGRFSLLAPSEEHGLIVDGTAVIHEVGYVTFARTVLPAWGSAVTFAPGKLGTIKLDLVRPSPVSNLVLVSESPRSITATFTAGPTGGNRTTYRLVCRGITRSYLVSGDTRSGFAPGLNNCTMYAENAAGRSDGVTASVVVLRTMPRR